MTPDHILTVNGDDAGARLDTYISKMTTLSRSAAQGLLEDKRVTVNGKEARASYNVKIGDEVEVTFGQKKLKFRVTSIKETTSKADASSMYEIIE